MLESMLVLVSLLVTLTLGKNGCRQCIGSQQIGFDYFNTRENALAFFRASLGNCATGSDYEIQSVEPSVCLRECASGSGGAQLSECTEYKDTKCRAWLFKVKVWRYCGNGPSVSLKKGKYCIGSKCVTGDTLELQCKNSVDCMAACNCKKCGCW